MDSLIFIIEWNCFLCINFRIGIKNYFFRRETKNFSIHILLSYLHFSTIEDFLKARVNIYFFQLDIPTGWIILLPITHTSLLILSSEILPNSIKSTLNYLLLQWFAMIIFVLCDKVKWSRKMIIININFRHIFLFIHSLLPFH